MKRATKNRAWMIQCATAITVCFFVFSRVAHAQHQPPFCLNSATYQKLNSLFLPSDSTRQSGNKMRSDQMPGYSVRLNVTTENVGEWLHEDQHYNTWVLKVRAENALALSVVFSNVNLLDGEQLYVYTSDEMKGPFEKVSLSRSGILPVGDLHGNEMVIEYDVPIGNARHGAFTIEFVFISTRDDGTGNARTNDSCYPCLNADFLSDARKSVVRIVTFRESETIMCTGVLMNNTRRDAKPYILTANHCLSDQEDVDRAIFTFNLEDIGCDGSNHFQATSLTGGKLLASSYTHDFSLIALDHHIPLSLQPRFAGWNISGNVNGSVACIHHPLGLGKKISVDNEVMTSSDYEVDGTPTRATDAFWRVNRWDAGITEGGSSGAPLFDEHQRVVGTLSGGMATCLTPYNDYFQKISSSWTNPYDPENQLKHWLDPVSLGAMIVDGYDPAAGMETHCDTLSNLNSLEAADVQTLFTGDGYVAGCNADGIASYAEQFFSEDSSLLMGARMFVGAIESQASGGVIVSVHASNDGVPGRSMFQKYIPYSNLRLFFNDIDFYPGVKVSGNFFISCTPDCSEMKQFAIGQADWRKSKYNTAWIRRSGNWNPMNDLHPSGFGSSLSIDAMLCSFRAPGELYETPMIDLYPNPSTSMLICAVEGDLENLSLPVICDIHGKTQMVMITRFQNQFLIDISGLKSGLYVLSMTSRTATIHRRFVKD